MECARAFRALGKYFVSFSGGDYNSGHYGMHLLWANEITGPYQPMLNQEGTDLRDFGAEIEKKSPLTWGAGRASFYEANGKWWALFHGALEAEHQGADKRRHTFLAPVDLHLDSHGWPVVRIYP